MPFYPYLNKYDLFLIENKLYFTFEFFKNNSSLIHLRS